MKLFRLAPRLTAHSTRLLGSDSLIVELFDLTECRSLAAG
jgi:hypothetical protein